MDNSEFSFRPDISNLSDSEYDALLIQNDINYLSLGELSLHKDERGNYCMVLTDSAGYEAWDMWEAAS